MNILSGMKSFLQKFQPSAGPAEADHGPASAVGPVGLGDDQAYAVEISPEAQSMLDGPTESPLDS